MAGESAGRVNGFGARIVPAIPYFLLLAFTIWLWGIAGRIDYQERPGTLGPDFWPRVAIGLMGLLCLIRIATVLATGGAAARGIGAAITGDDEEEDETGPRRPILLGLGIALTLAYGLVLNTVGFPLATALFLIGFMYLGGSRHHLAIWVSSLVGVALVTVLLTKVVYVSLPRGAPPFDRVIDLISGF
ncbi:tripartite tricarboxylate transporter TctB family protein [Methylobacterium sp. B4]|uniref:tripartite tricarboxylate transporter TctB family protein n=1 Tax=Methylobacterium sp. B4 TaxID=1938755 RepID=UPI000D76B463|nr:tripartite tricarboxylate transporter TctB family protein [Methylobacterium sp. B4]PXW65352.1 putative tricarboxylic transport membrane protein [Methylobacterium sp. B4]